MGRTLNVVCNCVVYVRVCVCVCVLMDQASKCMGKN